MNNKLKPRYMELLCKFADDKEIFELLELVYDDRNRIITMEYFKNKNRMDVGDLFAKLMTDLETAKKYIEKSQK